MHSIVHLHIFYWFSRYCDDVFDSNQTDKLDTKSAEVIVHQKLCVTTRKKWLKYTWICVQCEVIQK